MSFHQSKQTLGVSQWKPCKSTTQHMGELSRRAQREPNQIKSSTVDSTFFFTSLWFSFTTTSLFYFFLNHTCWQLAHFKKSSSIHCSVVKKKRMRITQGWIGILLLTCQSTLALAANPNPQKRAIFGGAISPPRGGSRKVAVRESTSTSATSESSSSSSSEEKFTILSNDVNVRKLDLLPVCVNVPGVLAGRIFESYKYSSTNSCFWFSLSWILFIKSPFHRQRDHYGFFSYHLILVVAIVLPPKRLQNR